MKKHIFQNERSLASAGSGKTYALTNRFISLVLGGVSPDEICALTFTRKAAAEFFENIINKLADASLSEKTAKDLSENIKNICESLENAPSKTFAETLAKFVNSAPYLHLETIDSFASRFVRFFAAELGLVGEIQIMDKYLENEKIRRTLEETLHKAHQDEKTFSDFIHAFNEANMGNEEKSVASKLNGFIESAHNIYINNPNSKKWGNAKFFKNSDLLLWNQESYLVQIENLKREIEKIGKTDFEKSYAEIVEFFENSAPKKLEGKSNKVMKALAEYICENTALSGFQVPHSRKKGTETMPHNICIICENLVQMLVDGYIALSCASIKAIYYLIKIYENTYNEKVRLKGWMSFSDLPVLIKNNQRSFAKELVEYRFDSKFSHWLFDEFQDTSRVQWNIFKNIIDEVVLNSDGEKSFYYVGDIKQSIYSWRGGDPKLFDEIFDGYNGKFPGSIVNNESLLATSWRSCTPIIDFVNSIFGDENALETQYGNTLAKRWANIWAKHEVAGKNKALSGCVTIQTRSKSEDLGKFVYEYIKELNPLSKKLSCAVLTRKNDTAIELVDYLRKQSEKDGLNMRVAGELEVKIASDNMAVPLLLALAKYAAHPSDTFAKKYLEMSVIYGHILQVGKDVFLENFQKNVFAFGFAKAFEAPAQILSSLANEDFTRLRISQFLEMARTFDEQGEKNTDKFISFANEYKIREGASSDTIQIMSIHKSKGLGFDVVILPELGKQTLPNSLKIEVSDEGEVFSLPPKIICGFNKRLAEMKAQSEENASFESLCMFYVALTRAKRAIHVILDDVKTDTEGKSNFAYLLRKIFEPTNTPKILFGDANWTKEIPAEETVFIKNSDAIKFIQKPLDENKDFSCEINFNEDFDAKNFGIIIHSILEKLTEFSLDLQLCKKHIQKLYPEENTNIESAFKLVKNALENLKIKNIFTHKNAWIEKPYAIFDGEKIKEGRFDRINFYPEEDRAEIIDFKTSSESKNEAHKEQLLRYKKALQKLVKIKNIELKTVSLWDARIIDF